MYWGGEEEEKKLDKICGAKAFCLTNIRQSVNGACIYIHRQISDCLLLTRSPSVRDYWLYFVLLFSSVQDDMYALGKSHMCTSPNLRPSSRTTELNETPSICLRHPSKVKVPESEA